MNRFFFAAIVGVAFFSLLATSANAADKKKPSVPVWTDPEKAKAEDPDFSLQGEYVPVADHKAIMQGLSAV